jgi:hypothetical protein
MRAVRLYDFIKNQLEKFPELRDSDKKLTWVIWGSLGFLYGVPPYQHLTKEAFMKAPSTETIRRTRQKIQELHKELRSSQTVEEAKIEKEHEKGTFVFREPIQMGI